MGGRPFGDLKKKGAPKKIVWIGRSKFDGVGVVCACEEAKEGAKSELVIRIKKTYSHGCVREQYSVLCRCAGIRRERGISS